MDPYDLAEKLCCLISDLLDLIVLFKERDSYLDSVGEFLNSIGATIKSYESSPALLKKKQASFEGMKHCLEDFYAYLNNQNKKNSIAKFFNGNKFITGCNEFIAQLQKWMLNLQLDLHLHYGQENVKNFEELFTIVKKLDQKKKESKCRFKDKFKNRNAAIFWLKHFEKQEDVEWCEFLVNFKSYVLQTEKMILTDSVVENICNLVDTDSNKILNFSEWDYFYDKIWSNFNCKAKFLLLCDDDPKKPSNSPFEESKGVKPLSKPIIQLPKLTLTYIETNTDSDEWETRKKPFDFPIGNKFLITDKGFEYMDHNGNEIKKEKNLRKEPLIFGKDPTSEKKKDLSQEPLISDKPSSQELQIADILFHRKISTISKKQFHITIKTQVNDNGYFLSDLSFTNPTSLRVKDKPFALNSGMLIDLNTYMFEIMEVFPLAEDDENRKEYIFLKTTGVDENDGVKNTLRMIKKDKYVEEDSDEERTLTKVRYKKKFSQNEIPYLKLRLINHFLPEYYENNKKNDRFINYEDVPKILSVAQGIEQQHETLTLKGKKIGKLAVFSIGSSSDNDIRINDPENFDPHYCQLYYDEKLQGWFIWEKHPSSKQKKDSLGTLVLLKNLMQFKERKIGSIGCKLRDGMEIFFNSHVLKVNI